MEKQITLSQLRAVFTKDFDTFGKMDPFLVFTVGKQEAKTQTQKKAGKQPKWTTNIILNYIDQTTIIVKAYEEDTTSNDYMGQGKIQIKSLKANGDLQIKILQENGNSTGSVFCKYVVKSLPPVPFLVLKNIKFDIVKDTQKIQKSKPMISVECAGNTGSTEIKDKGDAKLITWNQIARLKIKDGQKITICLQDKNDNRKIFTYGAFPKQFKTTTGNKKIYLQNRVFEQLGTLQFDYQTINFVSKQQSTKNQQAIKKQQKDQQQTQLVVETIKGNLNNALSDLYFKMIFGPNMSKSKVLDKAPKDFNLQVKQAFYGDKSDNKIIFAAYDSESMGSDTYKGSGELYIDSIVQGKPSTVRLQNRNAKHLGDIIVTASSKKVLKRQLIISDIKVKVKVSADIAGDSDIFVIGNVGGWTKRTQVISGSQVALTQSLAFLFGDYQKKVNLKVMDQDVTEEELMYEIQADLEDFKDTGDMTFPLIPQKYKDDKTKHGQLTFKYKTKNGIYKDKSKAAGQSNKNIPADDTKKQQQEKKKAEQQAKKKKAQEEAKKKAEEDKKKADELKKKQDQQAKKKQDQQAKKKADQQAKKKAESGDKNKTDAEKKKAEQDAKKKAEQQAKKKADADKNKSEAQKKKAEEQAKKKHDQEAKKKHDQEAKKKAAQQQKKKQQQQQKRRQDQQKKKQQNSHLKSQKSLQKSKQDQNGNRSSLGHSRDTNIKLPAIDRNYGDKIYDKQSSSTLQKSIHVYSMPKANRFGSGPKYSGQPTFYVDSCFKPNSGKGAGFGFGNKRQFPDWMQKNMKENPAPGSYFDQKGNGANSQFRIKGPTFVTIPKQIASSGTKTRKSPEKIFVAKKKL